MRAPGRPQPCRRTRGMNLLQEGEKRHDPHVHGDRRIYCHCIEHLPVLIELHSGVEWCRHNQRVGHR